MNTKKINKESLKEQIRNILHDKIISGEFQPNERLKIVPIAEALDVSQAPVREAIQCLITSGHLEHIPNVGVRVKEFTETEVKEIYKVREALEIASLKDLQGSTQALAEDLERYFNKMKTACENGRLEEYIKQNNLFHCCFVEASGNKKMLEVWDSLHLPLYMKHTLVNLSLTIEEALPLHLPIIAALKKSSTEDAIHALENHYSFV